MHTYLIHAQVHLDLTTDHTTFKALIHSSPTVADLNGDGRMEVCAVY